MKSENNIIESAESAPVTEAVKPAKPARGASQTIEPSESPSATPNEEALLKVCGNIIPLERLNKRLADARSNAGRLSATARNKGLGRIAKDMSGGGTLIPTLAVLSDLESLGLLGDTKQSIASAKNEIRGLNMIVDGLALLGLAKRHN